MLQSFSLLRPGPNGSKLNAVHSKVVKCNVKKSFIFKITETGKPLRDRGQRLMAVAFVPAELIHRFVAL